MYNLYTIYFRNAYTSSISPVYMTKDVDDALRLLLVYKKIQHVEGEYYIEKVER